MHEVGKKITGSKINVKEVKYKVKHVKEKLHTENLAR